MAMDGLTTSSNPITEAHSVLEDNEEDLRLLSDDLMVALEEELPENFLVTVDTDEEGYTDISPDSSSQWECGLYLHQLYTPDQHLNLSVNSRRLSTGSGYSSSSDTESSSSNHGVRLTKISTSRNKSTSKAKQTLPQFICETLKDPTYNPGSIKYLNENEGVFLIVKPKQIAELWGIVKGNPRMNYPSMSRGIRERRKYGWFEAVPADSKYPKKLTYKWGPRAMELLKLRIKTEVQ